MRQRGIVVSNGGSAAENSIDRTRWSFVALEGESERRSGACHGTRGSELIKCWRSIAPGKGA